MEQHTGFVGSYQVISGLLSTYKLNSVNGIKMAVKSPPSYMDRELDIWG
ncbi:hypothetical protein [Shewanella maritima]